MSPHPFSEILVVDSCEMESHSNESSTQRGQSRTNRSNNNNNSNTIPTPYRKLARFSSDLSDSDYDLEVAMPPRQPFKPLKARTSSTGTALTVSSFTSEDSDDLDEQSSTTSPWSTIASDIVEVLFAVGVFAACETLPNIIFRNYDWQRPLPYQVLNDGQVLLNQELTYPLLPNTVTADMLVIISVVVPILIFLIAGLLLNNSSIRRRIQDTKSAICMLLVAHGTNFLVTHCLKIFVGRFRPNFYAMCQFNPDTLQCEASSVLNAQHSFPSGHSSESFTGMTLLALYFLGKVGMHRSIGSLLKQRCCFLLAASPWLISTGIAASRIHDFMHHPADVLVGSLIGIACATLSYSMWYPSIYTRHAGVPLECVQDSGSL